MVIFCFLHLLYSSPVQVLNWKWSIGIYNLSINIQIILIPKVCIFLVVAEPLLRLLRTSSESEECFLGNRLVLDLARGDISSLHFQFVTKNLHRGGGRGWAWAVSKLVPVRTEHFIIISAGSKGWRKLSESSHSHISDTKYFNLFAQIEPFQRSTGLQGGFARSIS